MVHIYSELNTEPGGAVKVHMDRPTYSHKKTVFFFPPSFNYTPESLTGDDQNPPLKLCKWSLFNEVMTSNHVHGPTLIINHPVCVCVCNFLEKTTNFQGCQTSCQVEPGLLSRFGASTLLTGPSANAPSVI